MNNPLLIGNVAGYLVACVMYGQLLPVLTAPAIIGALVGGVIAVIVLPIIAGASSDTYVNDRHMPTEIDKREAVSGSFKDKIVEHVANLSTEEKLNLLATGDSSSRKCAIQALGDVTDENVFEELMPSLDDEDEAVRFIAAQVIGKIGNSTHIGLLEQRKAKASIDDQFFYDMAIEQLSQK